MTNNTYQEDVLIFVTYGLYYDIILRMPWLERHQPKIKKNIKLIIFNSDTCRNYA